jgi:hypothetical protein
MASVIFPRKGFMERYWLRTGITGFARQRIKSSSTTNVCIRTFKIELARTLHYTDYSSFSLPLFPSSLPDNPIDASTRHSILLNTHNLHATDAYILPDVAIQAIYWSSGPVLYPLPGHPSTPQRGLDLPTVVRPAGVLCEPYEWTLAVDDWTG